MNTQRFPLWLALVAAVTCTAASLADESLITGFTVTRVQGKCLVWDGEQSKPAELNRAYPFPTKVSTDRNSTMNLKFSEDNEFFLMARTTLVVDKNTNDPRLKVLKLETGSIDLQLNNFPKGEKLQVETPTAVCGAVGTRFRVSFEYDATGAKDPKGSRQNDISCREGRVTVGNRFQTGSSGTALAVPELGPGKIQGKSDEELAKGEYQLSAVIHEGVENTYSDITVNRGKLTFKYGGEKGNEVVAAPTEEGKPTRFVCALEKSEATVTLAALQVKEGSVSSTKVTKRFFLGPSVETTEVQAGDGAVVLTQQEVRKEEKTQVAQQYLDAAQSEGQLHSRAVDLEKAGQKDAAAKTLKEAEEAAKKATQLRVQMLAQQTIRLVRQLKQATQPIRTLPRH